MPLLVLDGGRRGPRPWPSRRDDSELCRGPGPGRGDDESGPWRSTRGSSAARSTTSSSPTRRPARSVGGSVDEARRHLRAGRSPSPAAIARGRYVDFAETVAVGEQDRQEFAGAAAASAAVDVDADHARSALANLIAQRAGALAAGRAPTSCSSNSEGPSMSMETMNAAVPPRLVAALAIGAWPLGPQAHCPGPAGDPDGDAGSRRLVAGTRS